MIAGQNKKVKKKVKKIVQSLQNAKRSSKRLQKKKKRNGRQQGGRGGYPLMERKVTVPAAFGMKTRVGAPQINRGKTFTVSHTEYLDDLKSKIAFSLDENQVYNLNPGLTVDFPWLSTIAQGFEQYRFKKLVYEYASRAPTSSPGTLYMATQLDPADPNFTDKQSMYSYVGTTSCNVWLHHRHDCLLKRSDPYKKYFVRGASLSDGQDIQLYDQGKFSWIALANQADQFEGELLVHYEVELFNPKKSPYISAGSASFQAIVNMDDPTNGLEPFNPLYWIPDTELFIHCFGGYQPKPSPVVNGVENPSDLGVFPAGTYLVSVYGTQTGSSDLDFNVDYYDVNGVAITPWTYDAHFIFTSNTFETTDYFVFDRDWAMNLQYTSTDTTTNLISRVAVSAVSQAFVEGFGYEPSALQKMGLRKKKVNPKGLRLWDSKFERKRRFDARQSKLAINQRVADLSDGDDVVVAPVVSDKRSSSSERKTRKKD